MLASKLRAQEELENHLAELKGWFAQEPQIKAEGMEDFFASRLDIACGTGLKLASMLRRFSALRVARVDPSGGLLQTLHRFEQKRGGLTGA